MESTPLLTLNGFEVRAVIIMDAHATWVGINFDS
jgi:hypothetical protein